MNTAAQLLTADDLWNMPDHGGHHELVRGELRPMSPAGYGHGRVTMRLAARLEMFVEEHSLGDVLGSETGFVISRNPDTVLAPDIAFVRQERVSASDEVMEFWPGTPDLAVETISRWDRIFEVDEKVEQWLGAGTKLVWVVDPKKKTIAVHRIGRDARILTTNDMLDGEDVVPGFHIPVSVVFSK